MEHREPSQPPPRPRLRRPVWTVAAGAAAIVAMSIVAARRPPGWYAARLVPADAAVAERDARRLVTTAAGLHAAEQPGPWGAAVREQEINAWLATDLPRNHAAALPPGWSEPRVRLDPGRIAVAARVAAGPLAGVLACEIEVRLRAVDQLECAVTAARLGVIPLPPGPFAHRVAALFGRLGFVAEVRRLDGRTVVVVSLRRRGVALEGLSVGSGELVVAGTTETPR